MTESKETIKEQIKENYYTVNKLVKQPWFPISSPTKLKKLIEAGRIKAVNISSEEDLDQYKISREEIVKFLDLE